MHEKLEKLLAKLEAEREELRGRLQHGTEEIHQEWAAMETRWLALQERLRVAGLGLAEKAGGLIESFEEELQELKQEVTQATWKLNLKVKDELHDLGEDVDKLQHKIADKVEDVRLEAGRPHINSHKNNALVRQILPKTTCFYFFSRPSLRIPCSLKSGT